MAIKVIIIIFVVIYFAVDIFEIYSGIKSKKYYKTYRFLGSTAFLILLQSIYIKFYKERIFEDAVKVKYHWIAGNEEALNSVFADYKKQSIYEQFLILELFEEYKLNNFELTNFKQSKKILREEKLYLELEKIYQDHKDENK